MPGGGRRPCTTRIPNWGQEASQVVSKEPHDNRQPSMSQLSYWGRHKTYVEIYSEGLDVDWAMGCESDTINTEECLVDERSWVSATTSLGWMRLGIS